MSFLISRFNGIVLVLIVSLFSVSLSYADDPASITSQPAAPTAPSAVPSSPSVAVTELPSVDSVSPNLSPSRYKELLSPLDVKSQQAALACFKQEIAGGSCKLTFADLERQKQYVLRAIEDTGSADAYRPLVDEVDGVGIKRAATQLVFVVAGISGSSVTFGGSSVYIDEALSAQLRILRGVYGQYADCTQMLFDTCVDDAQQSR